MSSPVQWKDGWPVRVVAMLTVAYSVAISISPKLLAKPSRLLDADGKVPTEIAELIRSIGVRDATMALALAAAPAGYPMSVLTGARVVADGADAVWFGRMVPSEQRTKIAGAAAGWAALELCTALAANRPARWTVRR